MFCPEWTLVKVLAGSLVAMPLRCRSWRCDLCQPERKRQVIAQARGGKPQRFITLTWRVRDGVSPEEAARELVRAFRTMRQRWLRAHPGRRFEFFAVFERTVQGWPHLHVLQRGDFIEQAWLSTQMDELAGSPVVDIRSVRSHHQVARYVAKYVGKSPQRFGTCKRYWASQAWDTWRADRRRDGEAVLEWKRYSQSVRSWVAETVALGWYVAAEGAATFTLCYQRAPP